MQKNSDRSKVLNELFRVSKMGMEASEIVLTRTHEKELSNRIKRQDEGYINLMEKARALLETSSEQPAGVSKRLQNMLRSAVKANTFFRHDPQHIAELMVRGSTMGIVNITKTMNHTPDCDPKVRKIAEDYINAEKCGIDKMKAFL